MAPSTSKTVVDTSVIQSAEQMVKDAGTSVQESVSAMAAPNVSDPGFATADAVAQLCSAWSGALSSFANSCFSVAGDLGRAGTVYEVHEDGNLRMLGG